METKILSSDINSILLAAKLISSNEIIGFPTETVYGLGGNAFSEEAVRKIFTAKNRPADNPLIVHISSLKQLDDVANAYSDLAKKLMASFWPGPLSLILKAKDCVPKIVTAGLDTVAVRMPAHPVARDLISKAKVPIAAPSANISGKPSSTTANHVYEDFKGKIPLIIDGGECQFGLESTVVAVDKEITILRPGAITKEMLESFANVNYDIYQNNGAPRSPGVKHPHYHPNARIVLLKGSKREIRQKAILQQGSHVGFFGRSELFEGLSCKTKGLLEEDNFLYTYAEKLYAFFRECDYLGVETIVIHEVAKLGLGHAIMDRITKAADEIV